MAVLAIALGATAPLLLSSLDAAASVALSGLAMFGLAGGFRRAGWLGGKRRIQGLAWTSEGNWVLTPARGAPLEGTLTAGTRTAASAVWLCWRPAHARYTRRVMLLTAHDLEPQVLRRLLVRLRTEGLKRTAPPGVAA